MRWRHGDWAGRVEQQHLRGWGGCWRTFVRGYTLASVVWRKVSVDHVAIMDRLATIEKLRYKISHHLKTEPPILTKVPTDINM